MGPRKSVTVKYHKVFLQTFGVAIVLWLIPLLQGKYAPLSYSYIPAYDISKEVLTIAQIQSASQRSAPTVIVRVRQPTDDKKTIEKKKGKHAQKNGKTKVIEDGRSGLPPCPAVSPLLQGLKLDPRQEESTDVELSREMMQKFAVHHGIQPGGFWQPPNCKPRYAVTVIVGQRNRTAQLQHFLLHIHPFLARQQLRYRIIVADQDNNAAYNRGKMFNIGYRESRLLFPAGPEQQCVVLHDVDLLPLNDLNLYTCTSQPRHMSVVVNTFRYQLPYRGLAGGAVALLASQFDAINGFSNNFRGWGGEDDDFSDRVARQGLHLVRFDPSVSQYVMLQHEPALLSATRYQFQEHGWVNNEANDGLSSVHYTHSAPPDRHPLMMHYTVRW